MYAAWLLTIMLSVFAPRDTSRETADHMQARFASIARDAVTTVERDGAVSGLSAAETEALMLSIAWHESGWRIDVDRGETLGSGLDVCLMQLRGAAAEARTDRLVCFREGLKRMKQSWRLCSHRSERWRLSSYASGRCSAGHLESEAMVDEWRRWLTLHPPPRGAS